MVTAPNELPFWRRPRRAPAALRDLGRPLAGILALAAVLLHEPVLQGRLLYERDIHLVWWAQSAAFVRAVLAGSWPVWDPSVCFGQPLLGDPSAQVLYPFTWLNLLMGPGAYYTALAVTHLALSGLGMFVLARATGLGGPAAFLAAGAWMASGPLLSVVNVYHLFVSAAWMPWVIWGAHTTFASGRITHLVRWGALWTLQILGGSAEVCAMTGLLIGGLIGAQVFSSRSGRQGLRLLGRAALAATIAVGASAAQWLPSLALVSRSARASLPHEMRTAWSVHPASLLEMLLPLGLNDLPLRSEVRAALFASREPFLLSIYLGLAVTAWAALGVLAGSWKLRVLFTAAAGTAILVALGQHTPVYDLVVGLLPPLRVLRYPYKVMILGAFTIALLAGAGFDRWARPQESNDGASPVPHWLAVLGAATLMAVLVRPPSWVGALLAPAAIPGAPEVLAPLSIRVGIALAGALAVAVGVTWTRKRLAPWWLSACVATAALADLTWAHARLNPTASPEIYRYRPPLADVLHADHATRVHVYEYDAPGAKGRALLEHADPAVARQLREDPFLTRLPKSTLTVAEVQALAYQSYLLPPLPGRWGLRGAYDLDIRGLYPQALARLGDRLRAAEGTAAHTRLLRLGGVSHVVSLHRWSETSGLVPMALLPGLLVPPVLVFRVPDPLPRAFLVGRARLAADDTSALQTLVEDGFDPSQEVLLSDTPLAPTGAAGGGLATVELDRPDRLRVTTRSPAPAYLVLLDSYDPGWIARLDGTRVPLLRANVAFRAVVVPAGEHHVELVYRPTPLRAGLAVSALTLAAAVAAAALSLRRQRHGGRQDGDAEG